METLFTTQDLQFSYQLGNQKVSALRGVSTNVEKGSFVCITGPSGSGKTTLLNILGLIEPIQGGALRMDGVDLSSLKEPEKNKIRKYKIGFVFQNFHLFPVLNAEENVEYFLVRQGIPPEERVKRVRKSLELVSLWEHRKKRPLEMSGGQRQRVAIARAIAKRPEVIVADEPTASLDQKTGREIMEIFLKLNREEGVTVILSSHDPMVHELSPKIILLRDGRIQDVH